MINLNTTVITTCLASSALFKRSFSVVYIYKSKRTSETYNTQKYIRKRNSTPTIFATRGVITSLTGVIIILIISCIYSIMNAGRSVVKG